MISGRVVVSSSVVHTTETACHAVGDFLEPMEKVVFAFHVTQFLYQLR